MAEQTVGIKITALDATGNAFNTVTKGLGSIQSAASQVGAAMGIALSPLALAAYATAMVTYAKSVINGIDALNDLKDATGASIENISALEDVARRSGASLDTVGTSLVKLNQALKGAKPGSDTERAIKAIGLSVTELKALDPAEAFQRIAVGLSGFADDANKARLTQELFGKSLKEVAPLLKDLAEQGKLNATVTTEQAEAVEKFNKQLYGMQTSASNAARALVQEMIPAISATAEEFANGIKYAGGFWNALGVIGGTNPFKNNQEQLSTYRAEVDDLTASIARYKNANSDTSGLEQALKVAKQRLEYFKAMERFEVDAASGYTGDAMSRRMASGQSKPSIADVFTGTNKPAGISADQKLVNDGLKLYNDLMADATGYSKTFTEDVTKLAAAYQRTGMTAAEYADALTAITSAQPKMVAAEKASTEAAKRNTQAVDDLIEAQEKLRLANEDQIKTARTSLEQIEFETQLLGLNADQRAQATMERELERQGIVKGTQAYDAYIDKLREAMAIKSAKEAGIESTEALAAANRKAAEESSKYWEDALMRAFESGKGFFESLWDTIKNTLKTQVLKVLVTGTMSGLGLTGAASAGNALSGVSGGLSLASGASSLFSVGSQVLGGTMSAANAGGTLIANATATGIDGLLATNAAYGTAVAGAAPAAGTGIASTLGAIPGWGWALAGVAAAAALFEGGETRSGAQYGTTAGIGTATKLEGPSGGEINGTAAQAAFIGSQAGINALLHRVGSSSSITSYTAGLESSENGKGFAGAGGVLSTGATFGDTGDLHNVNKGSKTTEQAYTQYINELRRSTLQAVQAATDIPKEMHDYLAQFDFNAMSDTAFDAVEKTFYSVIGLQESLSKLPFKSLKELSFGAAEGLLAAADAMDTVADNGLETLSSLLSGYYDNFYTESEKTANLTANTAASFAELGFTMPAVTTGLDDWYVGIMDATLAMDQSNPAVAQLTANLLGLGGSVATLGDTAASTQKLIDGIHTSATNTVWQMQYGMGTTQEQYGMWDVKINDLDTQMRAATDINEIARFADEELKSIKSSWDLLSPDQQRASFGEYKQDIANVDAYVAQSGATPRDIQRADNQEFADIVAAAVEKVMEKSANAQQAAADAQAAAAANPTPIDVKVTVVDTSASVEVDITRNGV